METEHAHSCVTETGFENRSVSTTNLVGGYLKEREKRFKSPQKAIK